VKPTAEFPVTDFKSLKIKMLNWANQFSIFCLLDNHQYNSAASGIEKAAFECLVGVGKKRDITATAGDAFQSLKNFSDTPNRFLFGHLGYDLKNETEQLYSNNFDGIGFPDLYFFEPKVVLELCADKLLIYADTSAQDIFLAINKMPDRLKNIQGNTVEIKSRIDKCAYINAVEKLKAHILRGDCYEINFCQEFFAENTFIDPVTVYMQLSHASPNPFSALYKLNDTYCICASPERYIKKSGSQLISQPIKGTSTRYLNDVKADAESRKLLLLSEKEKSENTMVVDLVRNDLSKVCVRGSVKVTELHGVYSFPQVHQMISTVAGEVDASVNWVDIIKDTFPMGSMTGAPKKRVMELIEMYEKTKRGLFSGAVGYVTPEGDFDFNVVIRSLLCNSTTGYISYQAGSAITFKSNAEQEYAESLLKVAAIKRLFSA
jgi:para-aminobenzoate synthetase component I